MRSVGVVSHIMRKEGGRVQFLFLNVLMKSDLCQN